MQPGRCHLEWAATAIDTHGDAHAFGPGLVEAMQAARLRGFHLHGGAQRLYHDSMVSRSGCAGQDITSALRDDAPLGVKSSTKEH